MEDSNIFTLLERTVVRKWRQELEDENECGYKKIMHDNEDIIKATLNEKQTELLNFYEVSINNYLDFIYYELNIKILNYGIQIGMQLQHAFTEQSDK